MRVRARVYFFVTLNVNLLASVIPRKEERERGKMRGIYSYAKECEDRGGIMNDEWN